MTFEVEAAPALAAQQAAPGYDTTAPRLGRANPACYPGNKAVRHRGSGSQPVT
jgi:hypothetical protein